MRGYGMNRRITTTIIALALFIALGVPARADASTPDPAHTDLSSLPKIEAYLGSIGVEIDSVTVQQGRLNYAGPNCPGSEWNCTTARMVVQLAQAALQTANIVECAPAANATLPALNECLIVQSSVLDPLESASSTNVADCGVDIVEEVGPGGKTKSKCTIRQSSKKGNNSAVVRMRTTQRGGSPQIVTQEADVTQTSTEGSNTAKITQTVIQDLRTKSDAAVDQEQNARQYANVDQTSTSGDNSSDVQQSQSQNEDARSDAGITQEQNFTPFAEGRNVEAEVTQTSETGDITSNLRQLIKQDQSADSPDGPVSQTQSNFDGGLESDVLQTTTSLTSPGVLRSTVTQDEPQTQDADTDGVLMQLQEGPEFCCAEQNGGTTANVNLVTQSNVQRQTPATGAGGQSTLQEGFCSQTVFGAECTVTQTYTDNEGTETQTASGMTVNCSRSGEGEFCFGGVD
jgi:hypothetical protein